MSQLNEKIRKARGRNIKSGISWNAFNLVASKGLAILVKLVLARLLVPEHFGLIAMVLVFLGLVYIFVDFGLKNALIQRDRDSKTQIRYDSVFWFVLAGGALWTLVFLLIVTPFMIWFYSEPGLVYLSIVMSGSILLKSLAVLPEVRLMRRMRFKSIVRAEVVSMFVAAVVAISLAFWGLGVWALVAQQLITVGLCTVLLWLEIRWRPRLRFSSPALRELSGFSGWMLGNQVVHYVRTNLDKVLIGSILGASALGIYSIAYMMTETIRTQVGAMVSRVMFPAYSREQADLVEVRRLYLNVVKYTTLVIFPFATFLALSADSLIPFMFGNEWIGSVEPLKILALASMIFALSGDPSAVFRGIGRPRLAFNISFWNTLLIGFPVLAAGSYFYGLVGASWAVVIHCSTSRVISQVYLRRALRINELMVLKVAFPAITIALAMVVLKYSVFNG